MASSREYLSSFLHIKLIRSSINCQSNFLRYDQVRKLMGSTLECESQPGAVSTEPRALAFMDGTPFDNQQELTYRKTAGPYKTFAGTRSRAETDLDSWV